MIESNKIQSKKDLENYNIICTTTEDVEECLNMLNTEEQNRDIINDNYERIVYYSKHSNKYILSPGAQMDNDISFYHFKKVYNRLKKQEKEKQKLPDFEVDVDGRIIKINNYDSEKEVYYYTPERLDLVNHAAINEFKLQGLDNCLEYGSLFASEQSLLNHLFKMKIRTKIKNIAFELNNKKKLEKNDKIQFVYYIKCDYNLKDVYQSSTAICNDINEQEKTIYCSSYNFLDEVKKEISKEDLIKYFKLK